MPILQLMKQACSGEARFYPRPNSRVTPFSTSGYLGTVQI